MTVDEPDRYAKCAGCGAPILPSQGADLVDLGVRAVLMHSACLERARGYIAAAESNRDP